MNDMDAEIIKTALGGNFMKDELSIIREFLVLMDERGFRERTVGELIDGQIWDAWPGNDP